MYIPNLVTAGTALLATGFTPAAVDVAPEMVYNGSYTDGAPVKLRIATGGAGQSGLVERVANAFINKERKAGAAPFSVAWYKSDTTFSIKYLQSGVADVAITYSEIAEDIAVKQKIALDSFYIFRDHFLLVGPPSNPAKINGKKDILEIFSQLHAEAEKGTSNPPVRFLSRYDKSATNIKDSELFIKIGQVPWGMAYSTWYHQYMAYPLQALHAAAELEEYTITDRGTYLSSPKADQKKIKIYKAGKDKDPKDLLLNPAHMLVGAKATNVTFAYEFTSYLTSEEGQEVITSFKKNEKQLYTGAPPQKKKKPSLWRADEQQVLDYDL